MENSGKAACILRITFCKITVKVKISGITPEPGFIRGRLICPVKGATVQQPSYIVDGDNHNHQVFKHCGHPCLITQEVVSKLKTRFDPCRFSGMYAIVNQKYCLALFSDRFGIKVGLVVYYEQVQGLAAVG